jgi:hypothetical protein
MLNDANVLETGGPQRKSRPRLRRSASRSGRCSARPTISACARGQLVGNLSVTPRSGLVVAANVGPFTLGFPLDSEASEFGFQFSPIHGRLQFGSGNGRFVTDSRLNYCAHR